MLNYTVSSNVRTGMSVQTPVGAMTIGGPNGDQIARFHLCVAATIGATEWVFQGVSKRRNVKPSIGRQTVARYNGIILDHHEGKDSVSLSSKEHENVKLTRECVTNSRAKGVSLSQRSNVRKFDWRKFECQPREEKWQRTFEGQSNTPKKRRAIRKSHVSRSSIPKLQQSSTRTVSNVVSGGTYRSWSALWWTHGC